ncbi:unnamed protein product [Durusdinium trenchii]|uniref:RNA-editing substrate-binding complex 6 protein domain-containing protein n=1 Tax=Durusdinium trenchii TaxID=1381693 RepID=A0ABP0Q3G3_9DINO
MIVAPWDASSPDALLQVLRGAEVTRHQNKLILRNAFDWRQLLELAEKLNEESHALNVCTILHRLAKGVAREGPRGMSDRARSLRSTFAWQRLTFLVEKLVADLNNMELTNCLWALAVLEANGPQEEALLNSLIAACSQYLSSFEPRNLALSAWALAKMGLEKQWCPRWAEAVAVKLQSFETRDMTNVIWAFATVYWRDERFLMRFCKEVEVKAEHYSPQDVGNTLWALATLSWKNDLALTAISKRCFDTAVHFDQQNLSISLWSYATLGYKTMNLFHHMTQIITERIKSFAAQGIANVCWALAKFQFQQKCLLMTIAEEAPTRLDDFDPQHMSILAWAYATLEFPNRPLLTALCQAAVRKMPMFNAQHMANMTWAMATLAHKDERYLHVLAERAMEEVARFNPQECSNLVWAFALLTFRDDALLQALSRRSQEIVADFIPQNLGNTAWAYNRLGYRDEQLMQCLVREAAGRLQDCAGQEVLDLIESIVTGGYEASVEGPEWQRLACWAGQKVEAVARCVVSSSEMPLTLRKLPDFDRALAVQDYQDHLASFSLVGLGFTYTCQILEQLGIRLLNGSEKEAWQKVAQEASNSISGTGNQSDVSKNVEAQEGLKICRTICVYRYALQLGPETVCVGPTAVTSGPARDAHELGLFAATLRHPRGGDGEFQALQACARASMQLGCEPTGAPPMDGSAVEGELWLHVSEVPCLSCVGAMAQFRKVFPDVSILISFNLGRQPSEKSQADARPQPRGS